MSLECSSENCLFEGEIAFFLRKAADSVVRMT